MAPRRPVRSTRSQVSARSFSVPAPVSSDMTMYACMRVPSAVTSTASACANVSAFDGRRPRLPFGTAHSATTLRLTLSRAMARLTDRFGTSATPATCGAQRLRLYGEPLLHIIGGRISKAASTQRRDEVPRAEHPARADRCRVAPVQPVREPIVDGLAQRVIRRCDGLGMTKVPGWPRQGVRGQVRQVDSADRIERGGEVAQGWGLVGDTVASQFGGVAGRCSQTSIT